MALNVVSTDRLSTNVKTSNLATGLSGKVGKNKNLMINGAFQVAQRASTSTSAGYTTVDRWKDSITGQDEQPTRSQEVLAVGDTGPWAKGFRNAWQITNGNQTSGAGAGDKYFLEYRFEAQDIANSNWDYTSASSYATLSFWVRSSVAQTFQGYLLTLDGTNYKYPFNTGALSANTLTKVTKTIPGNSNLQIDNNADAGLLIVLAPFIGTDFTDTVSDNTWSAYASGARTNASASTWWTTNDAQFELTGFQFESGDTATEFEHRSYGDELARCQRYFFNKKGDNTDFGGMVGYVNSTDTVRFNVNFPVPMRATPSFTGSATACYFDSSDDSAEFNISTLAIVRANQTPSPSSLTLATSSTSSVTAGQGGQFEFRADSGYLNFSAEL